MTKIIALTLDELRTLRRTLHTHRGSEAGLIAKLTTAIQALEPSEPKVHLVPDNLGGARNEPSAAQILFAELEARIFEKYDGPTPFGPHSLLRIMATWICEKLAAIQSPGEPDECPGMGRCHGSMSWCESCGAVGALSCDDPNCDLHRAGRVLIDDGAGHRRAP